MSVTTDAAAGERLMFVALVRHPAADWTHFVRSIRRFGAGVVVTLIAYPGVVLPTRVDGVDQRIDLDDVRELGAVVNDCVASSDATLVTVIDCDARLTDSAINEIGVYSRGNLEVGLFYSDEVGATGGVIARPIHSPERLRCQFYFGDLVIYRRSTWEALGGLDRQLPGAELYDLALRSSRAAVTIGHLEKALYSRANVAPLLDEDARDSTRTALVAHMSATGGGVVKSVGSDGIHDTRRLVTGEPLVSIVIPSRGVYSDIEGKSRCYLLEAVSGIVEQSSYSNYEFVIVLDSVADPEVLDQLKHLAGSRLTIVPWTEPFNFSDKINRGVVAASGEFVLLLNDDVEIISPDWIEALLALGQLPGAGMVGAMLYYADGTIQHAGHAYYEGDASHIGLDVARGEPGPLGGFRVEREVSGVTAACALMPTRVFRQVGGLSSLLPGAFNDVDLCMKVTWLGNEIYWTPHAELFHFESKTRDASVHEFEIDVAWGRWGFRMHDPRYWPYPHDRRPMNAGDLAW